MKLILYTGLFSNINVPPCYIGVSVLLYLGWNMLENKMYIRVRELSPHPLVAERIAKAWKRSDTPIITDWFIKVCSFSNGRIFLLSQHPPREKGKYLFLKIWWKFLEYAEKESSLASKPESLKNFFEYWRREQVIWEGSARDLGVARKEQNTRLSFLEVELSQRGTVDGQYLSLYLSYDSIRVIL